MGAPARTVTLPRALTIAGSDSGGGAGIQADLKTFMVLGCHGMSALTALTAQNTVAVTAIHEVPPDFVGAQIEAVATDIGVDAAKTGMLASAPIVEAVAKAIQVQRVPNLVVDPVFVSKSGDHLLAPEAVQALIELLLPLASVITPNLYETQSLLGGGTIESRSQMEDAARALHALGPAHVLVKGGHLPGTSAIDVLFDGDEMTAVEGPRFDTEDTHGTGCTLAAAITAHLAHGRSVADAVGRAKVFVSGAIEHALRIGSGHGPVNQAWALQPDDGRRG